MTEQLLPGRRLQQLRLEKHLSRPALVSQVAQQGERLSTDYLAKLEYGSRPLAQASPFIVDALRRALGLSIEQWQTNFPEVRMLPEAGHQTSEAAPTHQQSAGESDPEQQLRHALLEQLRTNTPDQLDGEALQALLDERVQLLHPAIASLLRELSVNIQLAAG